MKKLVIILSSLLVVLTFAVSGFSKQMGKRNVSQEEDYVSRITSFYLGTWEGTFEHLYLTHPKLTVTVNLKSLKLSRGGHDLGDEAPSGEVTITSSDKVEKFRITSVRFHGAYKFSDDDRDGKNPIPSPEKGYIYVPFENAHKKSGINFRQGLFKSSNQTELGHETFGILSKQETK